jgi:hypothetical protein
MKVTKRELSHPYHRRAQSRHDFVGASKCSQRNYQATTGCAHLMIMEESLRTE